MVGGARIGLYRQMWELLSLERARQTPLLKGPYISLSGPYREGGAVGELVRDGVLHPFLEAPRPIARPDRLGFGRLLVYTL